MTGVLQPVTTSIKETYERLASEMLAGGYLGHGIQEDLLVDAARWFGTPLGGGTASFADFFRIALDHHVALLCAVDLDAEKEEDGREFLEFLRILLRWVEELPQEVVRKAKDPLLLVAGWQGMGHQLGAQIMRPGGPAIIYWGAFRSLRSSLQFSGYRRLTQLVRTTLAHELIGHQLPFCTAGGPLFSRDDLAAVLKAMDVRYLELVDSPSMSVETFLALPDLIKAISRVRYYGSERDPQRYCANLVEVIAFAVSGEPAHTVPGRGEIKSILRRGLLCERSPVATDPATGTALYRGFDFSDASPTPYFVEQAGRDRHETEALPKGGRWLTLRGLWTAWDAAERGGQAGREVALEPGRKCFLDGESAGYLVDAGRMKFLCCPFGLFEAACRATPAALPGTLRRGDMVLGVEQRRVEQVSYAIANEGMREIRLRVIPLEYAGLAP